MPVEPERCYLYLRDGPDSPPVKVSANNSTGGSAIDVATSVPTTTSSYSVNSASSTNTSWSTTHYSNKSDTGRGDEHYLEIFPAVIMLQDLLVW